jgi:hypothetical protein
MKFARTSTHLKTMIVVLTLMTSALSLLVASFSSRSQSWPLTPANQVNFSTASSPRTALTTEQAREAYGQIALSFEANRGQTDASVNFLARGAGYTLFLRPTEAVFRLRNSEFGLRNDQDRADSASLTHASDRKLTTNPRSEISTQHSKTLRMKLVGADASATAAGANELAGKVNYFTGKDRAQWRTDIPTYGRVRYAEVYPGIDVVYYGNQHQLEYDFVVAPGSDARAIKLHFDGAEKVEVDAAGDLLLSLGESVIRQPKPVVYQEAAGARHEIAGGYVVGADGQVGFAVGEYDAQLPLIIDPVLVYSTYLGGGGTDEARDIAVDSSGNAYICGDTSSPNFPTVNPIDSTYGGGQFLGARDAFVTKLNATGTALVYSTYLGGSGGGVDNGDDRCFGIRVDGGGNAYVAGETHSADFPTANAFQGTYGGGFSDVFVTKLNAAGSALVFSTFIGGTVFDAAGGIELDSSNNVYITGRTTSSNFPLVNPIKATYNSRGGAVAFVTKLNAAGTALVYSTYLGGDDSAGFENGSSIAVDSAGSAYVTGQTRSNDFPTVNAIQATFGGGTPDGDGFVTKVNAAGSAFVYSTYLGGSNNEVGADIAVDSSGNAHVTGNTASANFPTANAFDSTLGGTSDGFVTKLNAAGSAFVYSTYLGGTNGDAGNDIALDSAGNACLAGGTISTDFPMVNPTQGTYGGGSVDAFVTRLNPAGSALLFSTYLGGGALDRGNAIAVDSAGSIYLAGITGSTNFPTLNPAQGTNAGVDDAFVTKISNTTTTYQFSQAAHPVIEDITFVTVSVTRTGDTSAAGTVDYASADGTATERADYTTALGTLRFAGGETSKTFDVLVNEDSKVEGNEAFTVALSNPTGGASLGTQATTTIQIMDDVTEPSTNAIDDSTIFVGQHYHDFLNRQSDPGGLAFWISQIESCGVDAQCRAVKRINVSAAFFLSIEFQQTGYFVIRIHKSAFGSTSGNPAYRPFLRDTQEVGRGVIVGMPGADAMLEANKQAFAMAFVQRADFQAAHGSQTADQYVDSLFANAGATPTASERAAAITAFAAGDTAGRAAALRSVIESGSVINKLYNPAFVLMQYFGYLRRNPNDTPDGNFSGYDFWLTKMDQFSVVGEDVRNDTVALARVQRAEMVKAFIVSGEYRGRFAP